MIGQLFALLCEKMIVQHLTNNRAQPDESFLHSLTEKVRHDWPISHVAMRESDTFHLTGTLEQKNHGNPIRGSSGLSQHR